MNVKRKGPVDRAGQTPLQLLGADTTMEGGGGGIAGVAGHRPVVTQEKLVPVGRGGGKGHGSG